MGRRRKRSTRKRLKPRSHNKKSESDNPSVLSDRERRLREALARGPTPFLIFVPPTDSTVKRKRRGRPRKIGNIYKMVASYRKKANGSWHQVARKFFPKDYAEDPNRCTERVRAGVRRVNWSR